MKGPLSDYSVPRGGIRDLFIELKEQRTYPVGPPYKESQRVPRGRPDSESKGPHSVRKYVEYDGRKGEDTVKG